MVSKKSIYHNCEGGIEKSVPCDHQLSSLGKPHDYHSVILGTDFFLSHTHDGYL